MFSGDDFDFSSDPLCCPSLSVEGMLIVKDRKWIIKEMKTKKKAKAKS